MPHIKIIDFAKAEGRLKEIYDDVLKKRGKLAEVHKIQSLNPETIVTHIDLYLSIMFSRSPLSRAQREMIAVVVSAANGCGYCQQHHSTALNHYWKDEARVNALRKNFNHANLSEKELALCEYAQELTLHPQEIENKNFVEPMKKTGITDREVLDATLVTAYFNFVNRIVLGLGVEMEEDNGTGYKY